MNGAHWAKQSVCSYASQDDLVIFGWSQYVAGHLHATYGDAQSDGFALAHPETTS
jgi:hypothetical protein